MIRGLCILAFASAALALGSCASVRRAANAYDELFAPIEGLPAVAREKQRQPLSEIARGGSAWDEFELARRFENGIGIERNPECAAFFYTRSDTTPYQAESMTYPAMIPYTHPKIGIPQARIAMRRLRSAGVDVAAFSLAAERCLTRRRALRG